MRLPAQRVFEVDLEICSDLDLHHISKKNYLQTDNLLLLIWTLRLINCWQLFLFFIIWSSQTNDRFNKYAQSLEEIEIWVKTISLLSTLTTLIIIKKR